MLRDSSTTSLLWKREGDQGLKWEEANVDLKKGGLSSYSLVFMTDLVTDHLR